MGCGIGITLIGDVLCFRGGKNVHAFLIYLATIICAERGARRYTYLVTAMYGQKLRKAFHELEQQQLQDLQKLPSSTGEQEGNSNQKAQNSIESDSNEEEKKSGTTVDQ